MQDNQATVSYRITALESAMKVLKIIGQHPGLHASQIAQHTGLTKSRVFRILKTFEESEHVWLDQQNAAYLGMATFILGRCAEEQYSLAQRAQPVLDQLATATQENVHLAVREGLNTLVVDVRLSSHPLRMYARVGRIGPLHAGGTSKVLLAYAPTDIFETILAAPLVRFTDATITSADLLQETLARIRQEGSHVAISDLEADTFSVAAPVFDHQGNVIAALSVAGPLIRFDPAKEKAYLRSVKAAARQLSQSIGSDC